MFRNPAGGAGSMTASRSDGAVYVCEGAGDSCVHLLEPRYNSDLRKSEKFTRRHTIDLPRLDRPAGIALSPDEKTLAVCDWGRQSVWVVDVSTHAVTLPHPVSSAKPRVATASVSPSPTSAAFTSANSEKGEGGAGASTEVNGAETGAMATVCKYFRPKATSEVLPKNTQSWNSKAPPKQAVAKPKSRLLSELALSQDDKDVIAFCRDIQGNPDVGPTHVRFVRSTNVKKKAGEKEELFMEVTLTDNRSRPSETTLLTTSVFLSR
jgi:hypothetical protein